MKIPLTWLREFVDFDLDTASLCDRLNMGGFEVDGVEEIGDEISAVVIGEIVTTKAHPNSDRLTLCQVRDGESTSAVVCGATNMKAGDRVALAPPGTTLPGGRRIELAEIRGVVSAGMLCSEAELGLSEEGSGILILPPDAPLGQRVGAYLGLEDTVLEIAVTPNRGDCLSVLGMAREVAALAKGKLLRARITGRERGGPVSEAIRVRIDDPSGCARYAARLVRSVKVAASPRWVQSRLQSVGLRPINNVVDVTNLVMIERGQPLHAFDYDRLPKPEIVVRRAGGSQLFRTLDGVDRELDAQDLLITTGTEPIALAGVMGGENTEVTGTTANVLLESAWFDPSTVRRTARRLDLPSEAAYRFERGVDIEGVPVALHRAAVLLKKLGGGEVAPGTVEDYPAPHRSVPIHVRPKRVEALLGRSISRSEVAASLKSLGASVSAATHGALSVTPPSFRTDLTREIDFVEEIARLVGYDQIPATMPATRLDGSMLPPRLRWMREVKRVLVGRGLAEAVTLSFESQRNNEVFPGLGGSSRPVALRNPINREEAEMRLSLLGGLMAMWRLNRNQGASGVGGFSAGKVYWQEETPCEGWRLAGLLAGSFVSAGLEKPRSAEFADLKGAVEAVFERLHLQDQVRWVHAADRDAVPAAAGWPEVGSFHPGRTAIVLLADRVVGAAGSLHPNTESEFGVDDALWFFELDMENVLPYVPNRPLYGGLPRFPVVVRDLAIVVDGDFASDRVVRFVREWRGDLVEHVRLFDQYEGEPIPTGRKCVAYTISYRASDRTLTDDEVNAIHAQLTEALCRNLPIELR